LLAQFDGALSGFTRLLDFAESILMKRKTPHKESLDGFAASPGKLSLHGGLIALHRGHGV